MVSIPGFTFTSTVAETGFSQLYRGTQDAGGTRVVAKVIRSERPTAVELARLKHEMAILESLAHADVAKVVGLYKWENRAVLVLEDLGDQSVAGLVGRPAPMREFLELACSMASAIATVHRQRIIHKDLKPGHFLIVGEAFRTKIIDFDLAARLPEETPAIQPELLEGTLAYMSPEQTGRVNRLVDFRSDQYALGVCFYQLLTGVLPFTATDPLELIHSHIARQPLTPQELRPEVPATVSAIVMKLLSKVAEDRYRSDAGLEVDLRACLQGLRADGQLSSFRLGRKDWNSEPQIPQKLYGRELESARLLEAFARVRGGAAELLLIAGSSGVGKSALVKEVQKHLVLQGHFVAGKFDQLARNVPYTAVAQACRELICSILTESTEKIAIWKQKLVATLGENAELVVSVVPELGALLGPQPTPPPLGPLEAQHRFERVFQSFLQLFTTREHPLVMFLDDLQWADAASLLLIHGALVASGAGHLLIVGAYRDNEVEPGHPLCLALADLRKAGGVIEEIRLRPLGLDDTAEFLAAALCSDIEALRPLAKLMLKKTDGNPFFLGMLLTTLHKDGLLTLDSRSGTWTWDSERLDRAYLADNVVEFMIDCLKRLSPDTRGVLTLAACVGHSFDNATLSAISERPFARFAGALWEAQQEGLIRSLGSFEGASDDETGGHPNVSYHFVHDRVQHAAYALIDEGKKRELHLRIGRLLLASHAGDPPTEHLFTIVSHLNLGAELIESEEERHALIRLDLRAARQARDAAAHKAAVGLLTTCQSLLEERAWTTDYELAHDTHLTKAQCELLCGNFSESFALLDMIESRARSAVDRAPARSLRTTMLTALNRLPDAIGVTVDTAAGFGVELPDDPARLGRELALAFDAVKARMGDRSVESLLDMPPMSDRGTLALIDVFYKSIPAAYQTNARMMTLIVLRATELLLAHGNAPVAAFFYCNYGIVYSQMTRDTEMAYRLGRLGITLCQQTGNRAVEGATRFLFAAALSHWRTHISESIDCFRQGLKASIEGGDHIHAGYCAAHGLYSRFFAGEPLTEIAAEIGEFVEFCRRTGDLTNIESLHILQQAIASLRAETPEPRAPHDSAASGSTPEQLLRASHKAAMMILREIDLYMQGDFDGAIAAAAVAPPISTGFFMGVEWLLFRALAIAEKLRHAPEETRSPLLAELKDAERTLASWAEGCHANHGVRHALVAAELAASEGRADTAVDFYERAVALAQEHGFLQHQALANELCAKFHLARGHERIAAVYLQDAHYCYERWGASKKSAALLARHRDLIFPQAPERATGLHASIADDSHASVGTHAGGIDLLTVIRATRAMTSELDLQKLLDRLMRILLENAGAQRGVLALLRHDHFEISAEATVSPDRVDTGLREALDESPRLARSVANYVARTGEAVVLDDARAAHRFAHDPYLRRAQPLSLLAVALQHQGRVTGVLYLENNGATSAFTRSRVELLQFLAAQAAIAITNARLHDHLEEEVIERTAALKLVLDSTGDGLLTVALDGTVDAVRSHAASVWFGEASAEPQQIWSLIHTDADASMISQLAYEQLVAGELPFESCVSQLPQRIEKGERTLAIEWKPVTAGERLERVLVVARDVSKVVEAERAERDAREATDMVRQVLCDKSGFADGIQELYTLINTVASDDLLAVGRALHTLKGNAAMLGLNRLAERSHELEDEIEATSELPSPARVQALQNDMDLALERIHDIFGASFLTLVEVRDQDLERLCHGLEQRHDHAALLRTVNSWRDESIDAVLERFTKQGSRIASRLGKDVDIAVDERGVRLPAGELRSFWAVFVHAVRNAVDHGADTPEERAASGKSGRCRIRLRGELDGSSLVVFIEDDGRGIDLEALRAVAVAKGLPAATGDDLMHLVFADGVSTKNEATAMSGRGIGLSAVRQRCGELGGTVAVDSTRLVGTRFTFRLPLRHLSAVPADAQSGFDGDALASAR